MVVCRRRLGIDRRRHTARWAKIPLRIPILRPLGAGARLAKTPAVQEPRPGSTIALSQCNRGAAETGAVAEGCT
jgi:hypothetical protein